MVSPFRFSVLWRSKEQTVLRAYAARSACQQEPEAVGEAALPGCRFPIHVPPAIDGGIPRYRKILLTTFLVQENTVDRVLTVCQMYYGGGACHCSAAAIACSIRRDRS